MDTSPPPTRVAVFAGNGKTGRAVAAAVAAQGAHVVGVSRQNWHNLHRHLESVTAAYVIAPNLHEDEPAYVTTALEALQSAGAARIVYHSVASPYVPSMPHHVGKAVSEDLVRRSGLDWTILQPGAYLQNVDLSAAVQVPYRTDAPFGFLDLADLGRAAATVLLTEGHSGATYELATRASTVAELALESGVEAVRVRFAGVSSLSTRENDWLAAMFDYYDHHGLPVGTLPLRSLLGSSRAG